MANRDHEPNVNPEHNRPLPQSPGQSMVELFEHHKASGSLEHFYELYPIMRPVSREPERSDGKGRSR